MADGKQFEYGQSASEVQFQDEIGKIKNRQGEAVLEVNDAQQIFLAKSDPQVYIETLVDDDAFGVKATDTALATAESIKAYVDASAGGSGSFDDITVDTNTLVANITGYTDKVGVATATPRRTLDVLDASNPQLRLTHTDNSVYVDLSSTSNGYTSIKPSHATFGYNYFRSDSNQSYIIIQNDHTNGTGVTTDNTNGLSFGCTSDSAYIWMRPTSGGAAGTLAIGVGATAITIDESENAVFIGNLSADGNMTIGDADIDEHTLNGTLNLNKAPADETCSGTTATFQAGEGLNRGDVVYYKPADSKMYKADADAEATSRAVAIAAENIVLDGTGRFLLQGFVKDVGTFAGAYTAGDVLYTHTTGGPPTRTAPSGTGDFLQVIGWAVDSDTVYFDASSTIIEIA